MYLVKPYHHNLIRRYLKPVPLCRCYSDNIVTIRGNEGTAIYFAMKICFLTSVDSSEVYEVNLFGFKDVMGFGC